MWCFTRARLFELISELKGKDTHEFSKDYRQVSAEVALTCVLFIRMNMFK